MGATETLRSIFPREKSSERPIFAGSFDSGVSAGFPGIPGSLAFAEETYLHDQSWDFYPSVAVRVEYERISAGSGDVDLVSLGLTFAF
jgi:hypothetical protein